MSEPFGGKFYQDLFHHPLHFQVQNAFGAGFILSSYSTLVSEYFSHLNYPLYGGFFFLSHVKIIIMIAKALEKGQALILIALAAIGLFTFSALAIDGSRVYSDRCHAQKAVDAAALAGALAHSGAMTLPP
jgi:putative Flp pilus-assembly TadE/G-like protein